MRRRPLAVSAILLACLGMAPASTAQRTAPDPMATTRPGRDPRQPIDQEYARRILADTTEAFFLSPLVDDLPAS